MNGVRFKIWTGVEMLGPFDLTQDPFYWAHKMRDGKILLCTGLKDTNGNEIYEGDIIKEGFSEWCVVEYKEEYAGFLPFVNDGGCGCCSDILTYIPCESEVIGNVFESKELLEGKE